MTQSNTSNTAQLSILPLRKGLPAGQAIRSKVLVRIVAPERAAPAGSTAKPRAPMDIAIVIDRSGSMGGAPLAAAIGCAENLVRSLREDDRVAIVAFDDTVDVLQPLGTLSQREMTLAALRKIRAGGSTALFDGWQEGAKQLAPFTTANRVSRVILLTDGQANQGLVDESEITLRVAELARAGVTTSTVGLGDGFNESLLTKMADAGEGQAHYGQTAEDIEDGFAEEFQVLTQACLRKVTLSVAGGVGVVANILRRDGTKGATAPLGTLPHGAALDAIVQLDIGDRRQSDGILSATVEAVDAAGEPVTIGPVVLALPEVAPGEHAALPADPAVAAAVAESDFADEFLRIHELARQGQVAAAIEAIKALRRKPGATEWARRTANYIVDLADDNIEAAIKELSYSSRAFRNRTREANVNMAYCANYSLVDENAKAVYLSKKVGAGRSRRRSTREEGPGETA